MNIEEQLKTIKPGKNYPASVKVTEKDGNVIDFHLNSFFVGMYCAIHVNGKIVQQAGDHNNKTFVTKLKKDLKKATGRGATIEIGRLYDCKLTMD